MPEPPPTSWSGWARTGSRQPWRRLVADCASEDEARELLHRRVASLPRVDVFVCVASIDPNTKKERASKA